MNPAVFAVAAFLMSFLPAGETDVTGTWDLTVESTQGTGSAVLNLKQDGGRITGRYSGRMGEVPLSGTVEADRIEFSVTLSFQNTQFTVVYTGTVEGETMKGKVRFGDAGSGHWSARRRP